MSINLQDLNPSTEQMTALLAAGTSLADLREFAAFRIGRNGPDARSSRHAQAWLDEHPLDGSVKPTLTVVRATPKPTSTPKQGPGSRGGDPRKYAKRIFAEAHGAYGTPENRAAYKSDEANAFADGITTHAQATAKLVKAVKASTLAKV